MSTGRAGRAAKAGSGIEGKYHELKYVDVEELERQCGIRLRFEQYAPYFESLTALGDLAERLADGQPAVWVRPEVLRDWHAKYHPTSGTWGRVR